MAAELVAVGRLGHVPDPPSADGVENRLQLRARVGQVEQGGGDGRRGVFSLDQARGLEFTDPVREQVGRDPRQQFAAAAATLIGQGDYALALKIIQPGLLRHPASSTLAGLRRTVLHRLMEQYQQFDPFKFLIYAELAGAEIGPVG